MSESDNTASHPVLILVMRHPFLRFVCDMASSGVSSSVFYRWRSSSWGWRTTGRMPS